MNYRIKRINSDYYIQKKIFLFWVYCREWQVVLIDVQWAKLVFTRLVDAKKHIDSMQSKKKPEVEIIPYP